MKSSILMFVLIFTFSISKPQNHVRLTIDQKEAFKENAKRKVEDLGNNISTITNKEIPSEIRDEAIENAVSLFLNEQNIIQVSSINNQPTKALRIRPYFRKIKVLKYSRIDVDWYDIAYTSELRQGVDGKYYGTISIFQKFTGYIDEVPQYADITKKDVEIIVERLTTRIGDGEEYRWRVSLGDIMVTETR